MKKRDEARARREERQALVSTVDTEQVRGIHEVARRAAMEKRPVTDMKAFYQFIAEWEAIIFIHSVIVMIDTIATDGTRGTLLKENLKGKAGLLSYGLTEYQMVLDAIGKTANPLLTHDIIVRIEGIRRALNKNDDGAYLRENAASYSETFKAMKDLRDSMKPPGLKIPQKQDDEIGWLCSEAIGISIDEGMSQSEAAEELYTRLLNRSGQLRGLELKAWHLLEAWDNNGKGDYVGNLWRNARRRGLISDET